MEIVKQEHKKQLHEEILGRARELKATLVLLRCDARQAVSDRARAIEEALAALETHLSGGWDVIGELEAAELTTWLAATRFLYDRELARDLPDLGDGANLQ